MKITVTDQMNRQVELTFPPRRIVSLVPSQSELLYDLGLDAELAGITRFCIHPASLRRSRMRVGGTKQVDLDRVNRLGPDLIIGNKEENDQEQIRKLAESYPVWMSDVSNLEDALDMIRSVGAITGKQEAADELARAIASSFADLGSPHSNSLPESGPGLRVAYFIWYKPWMVAANQTFIHDMIGQAGFQNVFLHKTRYPEVTLEELADLQPDAVLLSSEPYPFKEKQASEIRRYCRKAVVTLVDGEMFSWYGSRLLKSASYFAKLRSSIRSMNPG